MPEELDERLPGKVKRFIADNDINFYTIDAFKIGKELGLGTRTNTVLQSAFFTHCQDHPRRGCYQIHEGRCYQVL